MWDYPVISLLEEWVVAHLAHVILMPLILPFSLFGGLLFNSVSWDRGMDLDLDKDLTIIIKVILYMFFLHIMRLS